MPYQINIFNMKTNSVSTNGSIDIGPTVHNSHTSAIKQVGANLSFGDLSPSSSFQVNNYVDPDLYDQGQVANPSLPLSNQL
ncbi:hypothetical protein GCM10011391_35600 [Pullulanibacillus camelliae]|uniref:Spore germination protein n=1 Tax=Pullulanibacillus camelliae TaxID=1707096 RepID=A0A8J2YMD3_9BACL|nr:spore germination protein [Pullulanibacillus camelliae]GGE53608.1 hypothetical protein GCM10011391_35600 [Pullulanibacillus camelliae]